MVGSDLTDSNSIEQPGKIVPRTAKVDGLGAPFTREFPPHSISVLKLSSRPSGT